MRRAMQWLGAAAVGTLFGTACSSSDERATQPTGVTIISASNSAGAPGTEQTAEAGSATTSGGAAGEAGADNNAGAGAGGADACEGDYLCPAVSYWSQATITVDLPVSVAEAADAVFTACRNDECHSAKGSAQVSDVIGPTGQNDGWVSAKHGLIALTFNDSGARPSAVLNWKFVLDDEPIASDHYSLTIQPEAAAAPTTLFDAQLPYTTIPADPNLVSEGFCRHCSEVSIGAVDARTTQ